MTETNQRLPLAATWAAAVVALALLLGALASPADGQVAGAVEQIMSEDQAPTGDWDFSGGTCRLPQATTCAATDCDEADEDGRGCYDTDAATGSRWYMCEFGSGWVAQGGGGTPTEFLDGDTGCSATDATPDIVCQVDGSPVGTWHTGGLTLATSAVGAGVVVGQSYIGNWAGSAAAYGGIYPRGSESLVNDYALIFNDGNTFLNAKTNAYVRISNVTQMSITSSALTVTPGNVTAAVFNTAALGVNYLAVTPGAANVPPTISAAGADANINLPLAGKGTGSVVASLPKGGLYEKDIDGTPASTITVTTAGTFYPWVTASAGVAQGVTLDVGAVATCTALDDPYACCTGSGTGTCGDLIIVDNAGNYDMPISMSFSGTNNARVICCAYINDAQSDVCFVRTLGAAGAAGNAASAVPLALAASDEIDLRCTSDSNGDAIDIWTAYLSVSM